MTWEFMDYGMNYPQHHKRKVSPSDAQYLIPALSNLALEHWQQTNKPLIVAIDISIWSFQIQSGQKGSNPAIRTFHYRLCRLLQSNIHPLFIFDGPHKPPFKRNKHTSGVVVRGGQALWETQTLKRLIRAFGFMYWDAPGEAEAEAAMLQRCGVVDVVFTEDVDALMFGAGRVAREVGGGLHGKSHVVVYEDVEEMTGLDRDGLVLCAMMSGGDYLPVGLPSCGPKIAVEVRPPQKRTKNACG
jgi:Holliday junction resolvase YEN1